MRPEIRIIPMTQKEYDTAMKTYLNNYDEEKENYWDFTMEDFSEVYLSGMEIANEDDLSTQYYAVIFDKCIYKNDGRLYELPESFVNTLPDFNSISL